MKKIRSIEDVMAVASVSKHILTLFSGGLDSSYVLELLKNSQAKVTALAVDLGDGIEESSLRLITDHYGFDLKNHRC
ncbi:asparagine synthase-related protein [Vibrio sinaloensis]|nr:asparagine synthase-related protein [Vibrio sinaloensis]